MSKSRATKEPGKEEMYKDLPVTRRESDTGTSSGDPQEGEEDDHAEDRERNWDRPTDRTGVNGDHRNRSEAPEPPEDRPTTHTDRVYADPRNDQRGYGQGAGSPQKVTDKNSRTVEGKNAGDSKGTAVKTRKLQDLAKELTDDLDLEPSITELQERGPNSFMRKDPIPKDPNVDRKAESGTVTDPKK